jgi:hypothetical protein
LPRRNRSCRRHIKKLKKKLTEKNLEIWSIDECHFQGAFNIIRYLAFDLAGAYINDFQVDAVCLPDFADRTAHHFMYSQQLSNLNDAGGFCAGAALLKALFLEDGIHLTAFNDSVFACVDQLTSEAVGNREYLIRGESTTRFQIEHGHICQFDNSGILGGRRSGYTEKKRNDNECIRHFWFIHCAIPMNIKRKANGMFYPLLIVCTDCGKDFLRRRHMR